MYVFVSFHQNIPQKNYRRMDTPGRFSAIFDKGDNFHDFLFAFLYTNRLLKGLP